MRLTIVARLRARRDEFSASITWAQLDIGTYDHDHLISASTAPLR